MDDASSVRGMESHCFSGPASAPAPGPPVTLNHTTMPRMRYPPASKVSEPNPDLTGTCPCRNTIIILAVFVSVSTATWLQNLHPIIDMEMKRMIIDRVQRPLSKSSQLDGSDGIARIPAHNMIDSQDLGFVGVSSLVS